MSGAEATERQRYGTIVIVGGGCYGGYYVRQLQRAARAGALSADALVVVDRDPECAVFRDDAAASGGPIPVARRVAEWRAFFADYLDQAVAGGASFAADAIVPSPLMPHLMGEWVVSRARARFGDRGVDVRPLERSPDVPWERAGADGTHYVSFATWTCPVNCIEPRICPHTRDTRTWTLPAAIDEHARREAAAGRPVVAAVLHCRHRAYGVGMFDTREVADADARVAAAGRSAAADVIIGTVSHCHGALTRLVIGAPLGGSHGR